MNKRFCVIAGTMLLATSLSGCIDPYAGVDVGYASYGHALTADDVYHQDTEVKPRCADWAKNTNPKNWKIMTAFAWNDAVGGLVGGTAGYAADMKISGAATSIGTTAKLAIGGGVYYALAAFGEGAMSGYNQNATMKHSDAEWCLLADAGGYHLYSPKQGQIILIRARQNGWRPPTDGSPITSDDLPKDAQSVQLPPAPPPQQ